MRREIRDEVLIEAAVHEAVDAWGRAPTQLLQVSREMSQRPRVEPGCARASTEVDGKQVFALAGRGMGKHLVVNSSSGLLRDSAIAADVTHGTAWGFPRW